MTNFDIEQLMKHEPNFQGCFMRTDKLPEQGSFILNLDESDGPGTHWTAVDFDKKLYYDSYGLIWPKELNKLKLRSFNEVQHQKGNSSLCGLYCVCVIRMLNRGIGFYEICHTLFKSCTLYKTNHAKLRTLLSKMQEAYSN